MIDGSIYVKSKKKIYFYIKNILIYFLILRQKYWLYKKTLMSQLMSIFGLIYLYITLSDLIYPNIDFL